MSRKYVTVILSSTGLTSTSTNFSIYTDSNNYGYPVAKDITNTELTATTTPFNILVPQNASKIMVLDVNNGTKTYADINTNNLCDTCDLGFDYYPTATVGRLYAGNLTGTCQSSFGDYRINWYGPNSSTNVAYASGSGTSFNYNFKHPLTGSTGLFALAGTYFPVIDKVKIGGIAFSQSGNTLYSNDPVPALLTCFESVTVEVDAFTCSNGDSSDLAQYEHRVLFTAVGNGESPSPLNSTFLLSAGTKYFVWKFKGESVPDKLKLTYYGSAYNYNPIVLEYWDVGDQLPSSNYSLNVFPKSADTNSYVGKLTCLTGFTINNNDTIIMDIIPNTGNPSTNWDFYFGCFNNTIDCTLNTGTTRPYKIIGSSITGITGTCGTIFKCQFSGVPNSATTQYDLFDYAGSYQIYPTFNNSGIGDLLGSNNMNFSIVSCSSSWLFYRSPSNNFCATNAAYNITYEKSVGNFKITTNNPIYITNIFSDYNTNIKPNISIYSADSSNISYYRYIEIGYPNSTGSQVCGDGTTRRIIQLHQSSVVTTGTSGSDYWINYTMPTITNGMSFSACDLFCSSTVPSYVTNINNYSTGSTYNYTGTTNTASRYLYGHTGILTALSSTTVSTATTFVSNIELSNFQNETIPASGASYTLIPSLSGTACPNISNYFSSTSIGYQRWNAYYQYRLIDPLDLSAFQIYTNKVIETATTVNAYVYELVYTFSGGTVQYSDPNYIL
jgi:hypothetical protein